MSQYEAEKLVFSIASNKNGGAQLRASGVGEMELSRLLDFAFSIEPEMCNEAAMRHQNNLINGENNVRT